MVPVPVGEGPKKRKRRRVCSIWNFAFQSRVVYLCLVSLYIYVAISEGFFSVFIRQVTFSYRAYKTSLRAEDKKIVRSKGRRK
jgi:hypothetical protein